MDELDNLEKIIQENSLSLEEQYYLKEILLEMSTDGTSSTLDDIWYTDYEEIPVSLDEFLTNDEYLGKSVKNDDGDLTLYPYWVETLHQLFNPKNEIMECLSGDTIIKTTSGPITIEELYCRCTDGKSVHLFVYDINSQSYGVSRVKECREVGIRTTYTIEFEDHSSFRCTSNHPLLTSDLVYKTIDDGLKVGNKLLIDKKSNLEITSITEYGEEYVYDIEVVSNCHNFELKNGVIAHNCAFSGAIGIGKSTIAVVAMCYILYKLLCLKNPASYYKLNKGSKIAIAFFNLNMDQAYGVGYSKMQTYLKASPWFLRHGTVYGRVYQTYYPDKDIEFIVGSKSDHFIGRDVFCLTGNTKICTSVGTYTIEELSKDPCKYELYTWDSGRELFEISSNYDDIVQTKMVTELTRITLKDNTIIESTPEHKFLLSSGIYKRAQELLSGDKLRGYGTIDISNVRNIHIEPTPVYDIVNFNPYHNFVIKTNSGGVVCHNCGLMDELNFAPGQDVSLEKSSILKLYNTIKRRIESRFMSRGVIPGMLFLVSSKNEEYDFLEQYINKNKHKPHLYLVDEPIWVVKQDMGLYSGVNFKVAVGDRYHKSRILTPDDDEELIIRGGQRVIDVPIEYKDAFELDINTALADIAGVAITSSAKFFISEKVVACRRSYMKNPFTRNIITLGFEDSTQLKDFLIEDLLPKLGRNKDHYIHWDASKNGDRTGLSMLTRANEKQVKRLIQGQVNQVTDVIYKVVFAIGIKNVPGEEIPFFKIRNFIYYLRELGFNIVSISCDSYQSVDTIQQFKAQKFKAEMLSVDRSREPYEILKNAVNEGRLIMPYIPELEDEFLDVEDRKSKIDHTEVGCLLGNTLIRTTNGDKYIIDLDESKDQIIALDLESNSPVITNFTNLRETKRVTEYYEIETEDGQVIKCTDNHLILTERGYIRADELSIDDKIIEILEIPDRLPKEKKYDYIVRIMNYIKYLYNNKSYAVRDICKEFDGIVGKTTIQTAMDYEGVLRSKSESKKLAIIKYPEAFQRFKDTQNYDNSSGILRSSLELWKVLTSSKVKTIKKVTLDNPIPVYDIEVPDYHNFTLSNGLVVHNSKDILDTIAANVYKISRDYAPQVKGPNVDSFMAINSSVSTDDDFDYDEWILPDGIEVINPL